MNYCLKSKTTSSLTLQYEYNIDIFPSPIGYNINIDAKSVSELLFATVDSPLPLHKAAWDVFNP